MGRAVPPCHLSDLSGGTKYDLIANIVHEGKAGEGVYRLHMHRKVEEIW